MTRPATRLRQVDTVLFDLDGTLVDTLGDIVHSVNTALCARQLPALTRAEVREQVGEGGTALVRTALRKAGRSCEPALLAELQDTYLRGYAEAPSGRSRPYPGAEALLLRLRASGVRVALCTNKAEHVTGELLSALGLSGHFDAVLTAGGSVRRKPAPDLLHHALHRVSGTAALMVGDGAHDLRAAQAAAMPAAWVSFGYGRPPEDAPPDLELSGLDGLERAALAAGIRVSGT